MKTDHMKTDHMTTEMNRRQFIARTAGLAAAAGSISGFTAPAEADPLGLPLGIQLYTVDDDMTEDAAATVAKIAQIGYKEVEAAGFGSAGTAAALRKIIDANGLNCPSAHLTFDMNSLNRAFDDAHALGCTYATASVPRFLAEPMPPLAGLSGTDRAAALQKIVAALSAPLSQDELAKIVDAMNKVGAAAKQQGLLFASHNHTFEFALVGGQPAIYHMIEKTDPASVKFEIDCGWAEVAGYDPVALVDKYPGRIKMLHIKDFLPFEKGAAIGAANAPKGAEIGTGVIDYKKIFAGVRGKGIEHAFVEQEGSYTRMPPIQSAAADYKYLHSLS